MARKVYVVQCNQIECTDMIYVFSSKAKAIQFICEEEEVDNINDQNEWDLSTKELR